MGKKTPLYNCHLNASAKIVDFAGWDMPLHYGSQIQEHQQVRQDAGLFDVSHMTIVDLKGIEAPNFLRFLLANNIDRLTHSKGLYTCMLNESGGIIDDLIAYKLSDEYYRLVVNSATHDKDLTWLKKQIDQFDVILTERADLAMIALQGPNAKEKISRLFEPDDVKTIQALKTFECSIFLDFFVARTGYTGEDGYEIILPEKKAADFWNNAMQASFKPCGLGARDTLRLEAGLNLYGTDMDESVTPFESNLGWTVILEPKERDFIGRPALEKQLESGIKRILVGLVLETPGVLRNHQKVIVDKEGEGEITSGSFSPTLGKGIAFARIPASAPEYCLVEMRGKQIPAKVVKLPFVKKGKKTF